MFSMHTTIGVVTHCNFSCSNECGFSTDGVIFSLKGGVGK